MKIKRVQKLAADLHDKTEYVIHIGKLRRSLQSWISFEKSS